MTKLLTATNAFIAIVFLFACNQKPKKYAEKAVPYSPQTPTVDARLYLLYSDISKDSNDLQKLVNSKNGGEKLVFQSYFKQNGQLVLIAYSAKKTQESYDLSFVPVIDAINISDTGINYETISGTNLSIGNQELTNSPGNHSFDSLKNYLNHPHPENYLVFVPHREWVDSLANKRTLTYLIVAVKNLPSTKMEYESLQQLPIPPANKLSLASGITINPCPPRCN